MKVNSSGKTATVDESECTDIKPPSHVTCNADNPCDGELETKD